MMRELSLFTGGGGGVYASKLLGHTIIQAIKDRILEVEKLIKELEVDEA